MVGRTHSPGQSDGSGSNDAGEDRPVDGPSGTATGGGLDVSDRALSTVLDVCLALLLVGAAVLTLVSAPTPGIDPSAGRAEEVATTLAGSTATVRYDDGGSTRTIHGTRAGLLADAAVSNRTPASGRSLRSAVSNATRPVIVGRGWRGQVVAIWRPFEGANDVARVRVGAAPPDGVDVHTATVAVPSGLSSLRGRTRDAAERRGFDGVAGVLAESLARPGATGQSEGEYRAETADELAESFDSPAAAARAVSVGRVHLTVRTWSA